MKNTKDVRILITQGALLHYRVPVFNLLADEERFQVTIVHSGEPTTLAAPKYSEVIVRKQSMYGMYYQSDILQMADSFDVVIGMFDIRWLSNIMLLLKNRSYKFVWWGIGKGKNQLFDPLRIWLAKRSDALLLYDASARDVYIHHGIDARKVFVASNTVAVEQPIINRNPLDRISFLFIGSLHPRKQLEHMLYAFQMASGHIPDNVTVDIVGDGSEMENLRKLTQSLGIMDRVVFHGAITNEQELRCHFARALAVVSPGQAGLSVLHSFAHGVPFITQENAISGGEIENIKNRVNGFLYTGSIVHLAQIMVELSNNPALSVQMGENAYVHYTQNRTLGQMISGFRDAVNYSLS